MNKYQILLFGIVIIMGLISIIDTIKNGGDRDVGKLAPPGYWDRIKDGYQPDGHIKLDRNNPPKGELK